MSKTIGITPGPVQFESLETSDVKEFNPANGGSTGQVLTKTANGYKWQTPSGGGSSDVGFNFVDATGTFGSADVGHIDILVNEPETFNARIGYQIQLNDSEHSTDIVDNLEASVVFNRRVGDTYYYADASLSATGANIGYSKYFVLINGVFKATYQMGEDNQIDLTLEGTAMFSKSPSPQASSVLHNITSVQISIDRISICVNQ